MNQKRLIQSVFDAHLRVHHHGLDAAAPRYGDRSVLDIEGNHARAGADLKNLFTAKSAEFAETAEYLESS